ncbi:MAG TPA: hypothetical protein VF136_08525 [Methylomirabilota bacterium]
MTAAASSPAHRSPWRPALAALAVVVALLAAVAAALGVFARGDGSFVTVTSARGEVYDMATSGVYANNALQVVAEGVGWDVFTLVVAAPALLVAAIGTWRGSSRAAIGATGLLGYVLYNHLEYAVTWAFGPLFPLFVVLFAASVAGLIGFAALIAAEGVGHRFSERFPRRSWAGLSIGMSGLLTVMWAGRIAEALAADAAPQLHGETTMTVQALDLGLVVPVSLVIAVAALRRHPAGLAAAASFSVTFVAMSAAIAAMMISSWIVTGVPAVEPIVIFGVACLLGIAVSTRMLLSLVPAATRAPAHAQSMEPSLRPYAG